MIDAIILIDTTKNGPGPDLAGAALKRGVCPIVFLSDEAKGVNLPEGSITMQMPKGREAALGEIEALQDRFRVRGLTTVQDEYAFLAADLARQLGLAGPSPDSVKATLFKHEQKLLLQEAGVPTPAFVYARFDQVASDVLLEGEYPKIAKPVRGYASNGVQLCSSRADITKHAALIQHAARQFDALNEVDGFLIEERVVGEEYAIELFDGVTVGIIRKRMSSVDSFSETGYVANPSLGESVQQMLAVTAELAAKALGLAWGPLHIDIIVADGIPYVIEANPRIAGSFIPELVKDAYGADLVEMLLASALGEHVHVIPVAKNTKATVALVDFLFEPSDSEACRALDGVELSSSVPGVRKMRIGTRIWGAKRRTAFIYCAYDSRFAGGQQDSWYARQLAVAAA